MTYGIVVYIILYSTQILQTSSVQNNAPKLYSLKLPDLPIAVAFATAVIISRRVYVCGGACGDVKSAQHVQVLDLDKESWTSLPCAPQYNSQATAVNNQLVLIGGQEAQSRTITSLVTTWTAGGWQQDLPPLPTKRVRPGVATLGTYVIVAGGMAEDKHTLLSSIDVLNTSTCQWWTPANLQLPKPMYVVTIAISTTNVYVASAITTAPLTSKVVWKLPVTVLKNILMKEDTSMPQWKEIAPTPNYLSSLFQSTTHTVAVGGRDISTKPTSDVAVYDRSHNKWSTVGQLLEPRMRCTVVSVSSSSFLVLGGYGDAWNPQNTRLSSVELVHVS